MTKLGNSLTWCPSRRTWYLLRHTLTLPRTFAKLSYQSLPFNFEYLQASYVTVPRHDAQQLPWSQKRNSTLSRPFTGHIVCVRLSSWTFLSYSRLLVTRLVFFITLPRDMERIIVILSWPHVLARKTVKKPSLSMSRLFSTISWDQEMDSIRVSIT